MRIKDKEINLNESDLIAIVGEEGSGKTETMLEIVDREGAKYIDLKVTPIEEAIEIVNNFSEEDLLQLKESVLIIDHIRPVVEDNPNGQTEEEILRLIDECIDHKLFLVMTEVKDFLAFSIDEVVNI